VNPVHTGRELRSSPRPPVRTRRRLEFVDTIDQVLDRVLEPAEDRVLAAPG